MFRIAHVTDPHFRASMGGFLREVRASDVVGKRLIGSANMALFRRRKHRMELLADMGRDLKERAPDHLVLTGDLGNVGLAAEWQVSVNWLHQHAPEPRNVTVIPGNHDIYTDDVVNQHSFEKALATFQKADHRCGNDHYPFVRFRKKHIAFIGVNTCVPTHDLGAWGRIGHPQMRRLETLLTDPELEKRVRIILIHHPPVIHHRGEEHNLRDRTELTTLLARVGADLVLHGHDHCDEITHLPGPGGRAIPAIGGGSASYAGSPERRSRYNIFEVGDDRSLTWTTHAHEESTGRFLEVRREKL